ncbi:MAG: thiol:disulfide interchange protein DsbA/DsbL [Gammaproteobacteria bacterium]|jgi:thiol:disulfide interchange protein DsbA|nr:thiol:disulfide interchange protein DsbA/DsbL [Gammaproteobacteria bacterium]
MSVRLIPVLLALALALWPGHGRADDGLVEGRDFAPVPGGQVLQAEPGKVEVVEVFAYWCGVCNQFQPQLAAWARRQPADVAFRYLPAAFTRDDVHARAYFAAESLGALDRTHEATYRAMHVEQALAGRGASRDQYAAVYAGLGIDRGRFAVALASPAVDARMEAARAFIVANGVEATPTIIVNGRYRVLGRSLGDMLRITDLLVARERAAAGP